MFPVLDFNITGLEPDAQYSCMIQIVSYDKFRYRFDSIAETWLVAGDASHLDNENCKYMHPHGAVMGKVCSEGCAHSLFRSLFDRQVLLVRKYVLSFFSFSRSFLNLFSC